ncbi:MAG: ribonuclease Z [Candidatus Thorarchaeota archaeon]|nr:ribonuclease Z [Candidatus Thorarchaeota archaeon]
MFKGITHIFIFDSGNTHWWHNSVIDIILLGTGGSIPTDGRNHPAIAVCFEGWNLLFDCGEDCQRQYERANLGLNRKMAIFISHNHADHLLGLGGLLLRFSLLGRMKPLDIFGPVELIDYVKVNQETINLGTIFKTTVYGIKKGQSVFNADGLFVRAFEVDHRGFALGYEVTYERPTGEFLPDKAQQKGIPKGPLWGKLSSGESVRLPDGTLINPEDVTGPKPSPLRIVYSGDTRPCQSLRDAAKNANVLISEAMYTREHSDLAHERGHMTAADAALLAKESQAGLLVLTHYSPRYGNGQPIFMEAKEVFSNCILGQDLMRIRLALDGSSEVLQHTKH